MLHQLEDLFRKLLGLSKLERFDKNVNFKKLRDEAAIVLDVRTVAKYEVGHIENAINIPVEELSKRIDELKNTKKTILVYCRSGRRSGRAVKMLNKSGFITYNAGGYKPLLKKL